MERQKSREGPGLTISVISHCPNRAFVFPSRPAIVSRSELGTCAYLKLLNNENITELTLDVLLYSTYAYSRHAALDNADQVYKLWHVIKNSAMRPSIALFHLSIKFGPANQEIMCPVLTPIALSFNWLV